MGSSDHNQLYMMSQVDTLHTIIIQLHEYYSTTQKFIYDVAWFSTGYKISALVMLADILTVAQVAVVSYRRTGFNCENLIIANCEFF